MRALPKSSATGFALVITLVTIALLTIMAVAFLTSSSLDHTTAAAFANSAKAELAAKTAVNTAIARLTDNFATYSDSATTWENVKQSDGTVQYQGTTLYYRDQSPDAGTPPVPMHALPLISGAKPVLIPVAAQTLAQREANLRGALPTDGKAVLDDTNSFDLNHARFASDAQGAVGAPYGAPGRPEFRAQWINQTDSDGKVTSRHAYWMEDESFQEQRQSDGSDTPWVDVCGRQSFAKIVLQKGLTRHLGISDYDGTATAIFNSRANFPGGVFFEFPAVDQAAPSKIADSSKFEATIFSGTSNLSRTGTKRINLNKIVADSTDPTAIRSQLDQIIAAITYQAPNFAQRFYRTGSDKNSLDVPS